LLSDRQIDDLLHAFKQAARECVPDTKEHCKYELDSKYPHGFDDCVKQTLENIEKI
jgi:hypothetical protein